MAGDGIRKSQAAGILFFFQITVLGIKGSETINSKNADTKLSWYSWDNHKHDWLSLIPEYAVIEACCVSLTKRPVQRASTPNSIFKTRPQAAQARSTNKSVLNYSGATVEIWDLYKDCL